MIEASAIATIAIVYNTEWSVRRGGQLTTVMMPISSKSSVERKAVKVVVEVQCSSQCRGGGGTGLVAAE